jgi:hypothetical protein
VAVGKKDDEVPYTIEYLEDLGIVRIENTGVLSYEELLSQSRNAIELAAAKNSWRFLVDCIHLVARAAMHELYSLPFHYERLSASRSSKLAILFSEYSATNENILFYEKVCQNRGWQVKSFKYEADAIIWLKN